MTQTNSDSRKSRHLTARRLTLLASVGALGATILLTGPASYWHSAAGALSANASELGTQRPVGFADIVAKVKPAVISVRVKVSGSAEPASFQDDLDDGQQQIPAQPGSPLDKFFRQFGDQFDQQFGQQFGPQSGPHAPRRHDTVTGEGSGFFITADGYAVTNNHVVDHATSVQVTTDDGKVFAAKVVGTDPKTDLALIKVDGSKDFPFVKFAEHAPQVGDWVVAVGNPFGLGGTVTAGIVSARGRDIGAGPYDDYVQIDAPINKGNSGGPAFDVNGNVIGVNTAIFSPSGGSVGIGFDIPADTAKLVVAQLKDKGHVTRGWLGVQIQPVTADIADSLGLKKAAGAMVDAPQSGSPAAKAGIESGDVITAVNGTQVKDARDLARTIGMMAPETSIKLDIVRKGEPRSVTVTLAQMRNEQLASAESDNTQPSSGVPRLGLQVAPASEVSGAGEMGVVVTAVEPDGPAAEQGFQTGNIILEVGGKPVANASDMRQALSEAKSQGKHQILMRVKMGDATRFVALPLGHA
ncbi:MAG: Do family serine endopeptidase [Rhizobiales bacterium]|nr:Do family serine endopeptidase [Hyphomicrobiales bacterium]